MADDKKGKSSGGKKETKERQPSQKWLKYKIEGGKLIRSRSCPRCGPGIFLAMAKDRAFCGKCHYTEFSEKK